MAKIGQQIEETTEVTSKKENIASKLFNKKGVEVALKKDSEEDNTTDTSTEPGDTKPNEKQAPEKPATEKPAPAKPVKEIEAMDWQRIDLTNPEKPKLVDQIVFLGKTMDYVPGYKHTYTWSSIKSADGLKRVVTARYPKAGDPKEQYVVEFKGYRLDIDKWGNSCVCKLSGPYEGHDDVVILNYVSLITVLDVLQDLVNPKGEDGKGVCNIPWGTIDQVIKNKRQLKSRVKAVGEDDLPSRSRRAVATTETTKSETTEPETTELETTESTEIEPEIFEPEIVKTTEEEIETLEEAETTELPEVEEDTEETTEE